MMFGLRDTFSYFECGTCGGLQIIDPPDDLSRYYPPEYYSLAPANPPGGVRGWLRDRRNQAIFTGRDGMGRILAALTRYPYAALGEWLAAHPLGTRARVLDVGSGAGALVHDLALAGYPDPLGVDPFLPGDIVYSSGARALKADVDMLDDTFDLVILNHSLEHVPGQRETLRAVRRVVSRGGQCLIRTPTVSSYAWRHYRSNWVQMDAPRHFFIHSLDSIARLARSADFTITEVRFDSEAFQFTGSELYAHDVPGVDSAGRFSRSEIRHYTEQANQLNAQRAGDQIAVLLLPV